MTGRQDRRPATWRRAPDGARWITLPPRASGPHRPAALAGSHHAPLPQRKRPPLTAAGPRRDSVAEGRVRAVASDRAGSKARPCRRLCDCGQVTASLCASVSLPVKGGSCPPPDVTCHRGT